MKRPPPPKKKEGFCPLVFTLGRARSVRRRASSANRRFFFFCSAPAVFPICKPLKLRDQLGGWPWQELETVHRRFSYEQTPSHMGTAMDGGTTRVGG